MRAIMVHVLATIGLWSCQKAIDMADHGHLDFEAELLPKQPVLMYYNKPRRKSNWGFMILAILIAGFLVWSVLTVAYSIDNAGHKVTEELKKEHKEEMKIKCIPNKIFRKYATND